MFFLQKRIFWLVLSIIAILNISAEVHAANAVKIMPLGDSITKGTGSAYAWGYREPLYVSLVNGGYCFDFVGGLTDGSFSDPNHEGHYGWRADEILNGRPSDPAAGKLANWLPAGQPDVILLHIGTNDITAGNQDANEVNSILNIIDAYEVTSGKNIPVVLALIINRASYSSATTIYNNDLNTMATRRISNGDNIVIVNMENALNYSTDMADNLHPNDNGYVKMANVWYGALADYFDSLALVISGYVLEADDNTPVEGVLIQADGNAVAAETDANGFYEFCVDRGWSSVVAAQKDGYVFEPNSIAYSDVNQNYTDMNYTATLMTFKISGFVFEQDSVTPISDVNIDADNGGGAALTDANGCYEIIVDYNWSGDVTAGKYAYSFEPNSRHYEFVNHNFIADQNFTGNEYDFKITGFIKNQCNVPVEGVSIDADNGGGEGTTDVNGFYEVWVDSDWSGTVTPTKQYYTFNPASISYFSVLADQPDQNYIADNNIYDLDCDGYIGLGDIGIMAENWLGTGSADFDQSGKVDFLDLAALSMVW